MDEKKVKQVLWDIRNHAAGLLARDRLDETDTRLVKKLQQMAVSLHDELDNLQEETEMTELKQSDKDWVTLAAATGDRGVDRPVLSWLHIEDRNSGKGSLLWAADGYRMHVAQIAKRGAGRIELPGSVEYEDGKGVPDLRDIYSVRKRVERWERLIRRVLNNKVKGCKEAWIVKFNDHLYVVVWDKEHGLLDYHVLAGAYSLSDWIPVLVNVVFLQDALSVGGPYGALIGQVGSEGVSRVVIRSSDKARTAIIMPKAVGWMTNNEGEGERVAEALAVLKRETLHA